MRSMTPVLALAALFFVGGELQAQAPSSSAVEGELRTLVAAPATAEQDREVVRAFLERGDVTNAVSTNGLDIDRLKTALNTLPDDAVADLAEQVQNATDDADDLVGGNTIVISASTVIIILLLIILVS